MTALLTVLVSMLAAAAAAPAAQAAEVRLLHAVPGAGAALLTVDGEPAGSPVSFGRVGGYSDAPDGEVRLAVRPTGGGDASGDEKLSLGPGRQTVVAWRQEDGEVKLTVYRDGRAKGATARLRGVNVAGELGEAALKLDGREIGDALATGKAGSYDDVEPGTYELSVTRAEGGPALATKRGVDLVAGTASTAFVVGSGGEPVQVVTAADSSVTPERPPATGLGGLGGGTSWLAVIAAGFAAGALGGGAYLFAARRRGRAG